MGEIHSNSLGNCIRVMSPVCRLAPTLKRDQIVLVNLSGRGDKDVISVQKALAGGNGRG